MARALGGIISECRAGINRNDGRDQPGIRMGELVRWQTLRFLFRLTDSRFDLCLGNFAFVVIHSEA